MKYLHERTEDKLIIKKSEFIGILYPFEKDEDFDLALADAKKRYPKATHYVTAWIRGDRGQYASSNDDGEPSRTAGYPALEVLMHHELTDVLCVIIRYFGGIHLGAGGLIRAYRASAVVAYESGKFYHKVQAKKFEITFPYKLVDTIEHLLGDNVSYINKTYLKDVTYEVVFTNKDISLLDNVLHQGVVINELPEETLKIDI